MKNIFSIAFSAFILVVVYAFASPKVDFKTDAAEGIQFHKGTWEEALTQAKEENKLIFLDIYASWCGPCKQLKKNTFSNSEVGEYYNNNFVSVAFDGEKGEGAVLAQKYRISAYPSLLFIDGNGNIIGKAVGYHNPDEIIELGQKFFSL